MDLRSAAKGLFTAAKIRTSELTERGFLSFLIKEKKREIWREMIISAIYIRPTKRIIYSFDHSDLIDSSSDWAPFSNLFVKLSRMMTDDSAWPAAVSHIIGPHSDTRSNACHHGEEILFKIQSHKKKHLKGIRRGEFPLFLQPGGPRTHTLKLVTLEIINRGAQSRWRR